MVQASCRLGRGRPRGLSEPLLPVLVPPSATQPRVQLVQPLLVRNLCFPYPTAQAKLELSEAVFSGDASICLLPAAQNVLTFPLL